MYKIIAISAAAFLAASSAAVAADAIRPAPVVPVAPVVDSSSIWDGFYAGGNVGYGWGTGTVGGVSDDIEGWLGGAQVGYNFSSGAIVFGVEADIQAANIVYTEDLGGGVTGEAGIGTFGTVRARVGADLDGFLPYFTAGVAYGDLYADVSGGGVSVSSNEWAWGYAVGGGVEAAVADNFSIKAEYLYLDFGDVTFDAFGVDASANAHTVRLGANFHF